jgi:hypothetical protein
VSANEDLVPLVGDAADAAAHMGKPISEIGGDREPCVARGIEDSSG